MISAFRSDLTRFRVALAALLVVQFALPGLAAAAEIGHGLDLPDAELHVESQDSDHCEPGHDHGACQVARTLGLSLVSDLPKAVAEAMPPMARSERPVVSESLDSAAPRGTSLSRAPPSV